MKNKQNIDLIIEVANTVKLKKFNEWLDTFLEEKGIDLEETFELRDNGGVEHTMPYGVVVEHIKMTTSKEQAAIKEIIVKIDFKNGDVRHFFRHLAQAIVNRG